MNKKEEIFHMVLIGHQNTENIDVIDYEVDIVGNLHEIVNGLVNFMKQDEMNFNIIAHAVEHYFESNKEECDKPIKAD